MSEVPEALDIIDCGRCGERHMVKVHPLNNPADEWRWWAMCPATDQPILITVKDEGVSEKTSEEKERLAVMAAFECRDALQAATEHRWDDFIRHALEAAQLLNEVGELSDG